MIDVLDSKTVVSADYEVMRRAGRISGERYEAGEPIDREDCIIAATTILEDEPVLTRNADRFEHVPALAVDTY